MLLHRGPFASTPVEAAVKRGHSPFLLSSVKKHRDGREELLTSAEFSSPKLNNKLSSKRLVYNVKSTRKTACAFIFVHPYCILEMSLCFPHV